MNRKRALLLVDLKYRDLPGLALVKVLLECKGPYDVVLAPHAAGYSDQLALVNGNFHLVAFPQYLQQEQVTRAHFLKRHGIGVAVIPTEGTSLLNEVRLQIAGRFVDSSPVDLFFIWNGSIADLVQAHRTIPWERCIVGGVPRFDFYHPRFRSLRLSRDRFCEKYALNPEHRIVTWATNFGWVKLRGERLSTIQRIERRYREEGLHGTFWSRDLQGVVEREIESRELLTDQLLHFARKFPEVNVIIKVHPGERPEWYERRVASAGLKNVRVISQEYMFNVLEATDVHLHRSCTTAIEAWLLGKPTIDLQFAPREYHFSEELALGGDVAFSREDCMAKIAHYVAGGALPSEQATHRPRIIEWFCGQVDGQSALRHVEAIQRWLEGSDNQRTMPSATSKDLRLAVILQIKSLLGLQPYDSLRAWLRGDFRRHFTSSEVEMWVEMIRKTLRNQKPQ